MSKDFGRESVEQKKAAVVAAGGAQNGAELEPGVITTLEESAAVEAAEAPENGNSGEPVELVVKEREKKEPGAEKAKGTYVHTFRRPVKFEGTTYKTLTS